MTKLPRQVDYKDSGIHTGRYLTPKTLVVAMKLAHHIRRSWYEYSELLSLAKAGPFAWLLQRNS